MRGNTARSTQLISEFVRKPEDDQGYITEKLRPVTTSGNAIFVMNNNDFGYSENAGQQR